MRTEYRHRKVEHERCAQEAAKAARTAGVFAAAVPNEENRGSRSIGLKRSASPNPSNKVPALPSPEELSSGDECERWNEFPSEDERNVEEAPSDDDQRPAVKKQRADKAGSSLTTKAAAAQ